MFWVIKTVFIYLFSMPVSLAQWRGEIDACYNNTLAFSKISIFCLIVSLPYGCVFCRLDLIKLLFLIISLILNRIMSFHFKKCRNNSLAIGVYLFTIYLLITSNESLASVVTQRLILVKSNALNWWFSICYWNLNCISAHMFTKVSLLWAYIFVHIICLFETYLNSEISSDDEIWKFLDTILSEKITHLTVNKVKSVFIIKARSHLEQFL